MKNIFATLSDHGKANELFGPVLISFLFRLKITQEHKVNRKTGRIDCKIHQKIEQDGPRVPHSMGHFRYFMILCGTVCWMEWHKHTHTYFQNHLYTITTPKWSEMLRVGRGELLSRGALPGWDADSILFD